MTVTETTKGHVIRNYIEPARLRGETTVQVRVGNVLKELGWTNRTPSVFSTLSSQPFQREAGVELIEKKGGPASGGPSTTVQFTYRLRQSPSSDDSGPRKPKTGVLSLMDLYGIFKGGYDDVGGSDAFMSIERDWGSDLWQRYETERNAPNTNPARKKKP
jgi:hypothetical protein